jgi:HEAT repeat protein
LDGIAGFEVLGPNAAPATGELTKLLEDKELAFVAARCLENLGKSAESALCRCLTNSDWRVRHLGVSALASVTDDVEVYVARIKPRLNDVEPAVRFATVQAIGAQADAADVAVPVVVPALQDADELDQWMCGGVWRYSPRARTRDLEPIRQTVSDELAGRIAAQTNFRAVAAVAETSCWRFRARRACFRWSHEAAARMKRSRLAISTLCRSFTGSE